MSAKTGSSDHLITSIEQLEALYGEKNPNSIAKEIDYINDNYRKLIEAAPFVAIATGGPDGLDCSPKGDAPGFVRVLDERTLAIPDRPGNNRLDTQTNILANPSVGLLFMIPGFDDTLRINGTAQITRDPALLALMVVNDRLPRVAIAVTVTEVFLHCAKAFRRAGLWDPSQRQDRRAMPSLVQIILDQTTGAPDDPADLQKLDADLEADYQKSMY